MIRLRDLPSVERVISHQRMKDISEGFSHRWVVSLVRQRLEEVRSLIRTGHQTPTLTEIVESVVNQVESLGQVLAKPVINATGVVLHTNMGRAPLSKEAARAMVQISQNYSNLELNMSEGKRGSRQAYVQSLLCFLTDAEAALVVNNNASALLLGLSTLSSKREVIISRGEAVEIGGGFRIPGVMIQSGTILREVGTTNRTYISDYEAAITENTAALHYLGRAPQRGGVPSVEDVIALGNKHNIPVIVDAAGETWPVDGLSKFAAAGADLVAYAAKYFNAPHSTGILCGKKELIDIAFKHTFVGFQYGTMGIGRGYKIERHEIVAVVEGLKEWLSMDHEERLIAEDNMVATITAAVKDIKGVDVTQGTRAMTGGTWIPLSQSGGLAGSMQISIDPQMVGKTAGEVAEELAGGNPSIFVGVRRADLAGGTDSMESHDVLGLTVICMEEDQAVVVAERLRAALLK